MGRVTGLGGVFFKAENPEKLYEWYEKHLGIKQDVPGQGVSFRWKEDGDRRVDRSQSGRLRLRAICLDHGPGRKPH
jgi:hypothetical protein